MDLKEANENLLYRSSRPWAVFEMALANIDAASPKAAPPEVSRGEWLALALRFAGKTHYRRQLEFVSDLVRKDHPSGHSAAHRSPFRLCCECK